MYVWTVNAICSTPAPAARPSKRPRRISHNLGPSGWVWIRKLTAHSLIIQTYQRRFTGADVFQHSSRDAVLAARKGSYESPASPTGRQRLSLSGPPTTKLQHDDPLKICDQPESLSITPVPWRSKRTKHKDSGDFIVLERNYAYHFPRFLAKRLEVIEQKKTNPFTKNEFVRQHPDTIINHFN